MTGRQQEHDKSRPATGRDDTPHKPSQKVIEPALNGLKALSDKVGCASNVALENFGRKD